METTAHLATTTGTVARVGAGRVRLAGLEVEDRVLADLLDRRPREQWDDLVRRALSVGARGLVDMGLGLDIDEIDGRVRTTLESIAAEAQACTRDAIAAAERAFAEHLDPDLRTSLVARALADLGATRDDLIARLDPAASGTPTGRFIGELTALLGPQGQLEATLRQALDPEADGSALGRLARSIDGRLCELRDAVMRESGRSAEAERGTVKGLEFEDRVEGFLRVTARSWGAVVDRLGREPGRLGAECVVGDFVVALADGRRIVVEAKNAARIGLTGRNGILDELDRALSNREADFAICVSAQDAFPAEVGSFGVYGNRALVVDDGDGSLLTVALRWAQAASAAAAGNAERLDTAVVLERMERLRGLAQRFSTAKRALTEVRASVEGVRDHLDAMRSDLLDLVEDVVREVNAGKEGHRQVA